MRDAASHPAQATSSQSALVGENDAAHAFGSDDSRGALAEARRSLEALGALTFAFCFMAAIIGFVVVTLITNPVPATWGGRAALWLGGPLLATAEFLILRAANRAYAAGLFPLAPRFALAQPSWPLLLRPIMAAWWVAHVVAALMLGELVHRHLMDLHHLEAAAEAIKWGFSFAVFVVAMHASNLYLLLAITSLWRSERIVRVLWRLRAVIDLTVAAAFVTAAAMRSNG